MAGVDGFQLRALTAADTDAVVALGTAQGWRNRRLFYDLVLRTPSCQALAGCIDGRVVATGVATASVPVGWLGGIIVDAEFRGRGLGRLVTEELCRLLRAAGCTTLSLEATDQGRPMYERMGFRLTTHYHQLQADQLDDEPAVHDGAHVRPARPADLPAVFELDRLATAEDRSAPLGVLAGGGSAGSGAGPASGGAASGSAGWVMERGGAICGFLFPSERAYGAIVAPRFEDGIFLLDWHRHVVPAGSHVRAGIPDEHAAAWRALQERGWAETWQAPRLLLGPDVPWRPAWIWGQINSAMG